MNTIAQANLSLNARNTPIEQVAYTFVPNERYSALREPSHSVLLGPRGSGKTTLFKMLTRKAVNRWNSDIKNPPIQATSFMSIYIPSDIHWNTQISAIWKNLKISKVVGEKLARAAMNLGIIRAIIDSIEIESLDDASKSFDLSAAIARHLDIQVRHYGFDSLRIALAKIRMSISDVTNREPTEDRIEEIINSFPVFCRSDYLPVVRLIKEVFDSSYNTEGSRQWALCFDELEICPDWLQKMIVAEMRSTDQDLLYKISASPIPANFTSTFADHLNDFNVIKMWPHGETKEDEFSRLLASSWLSRYLNREEVDCENLFGGIQNKKGYSQGNEGYEVIQEIAKSDKFIHKFLQSKEIEISRLSEVSQKKKDSILRKLKPVCDFRMAYLDYDKKIDPDKKTYQEKVLKRPPALLYSGFEQILLVSDYNPRRLVVILERLMREAKRESIAISSVARETQVRVLQTIGHEFSAYISAFEESQCIIQDKRVALIEFINVISEYFREQLLGVNITIDPVGGFSVAEEIAGSNPSLCEMIRKAAWLGAIVNTDVGSKTSPLDGKVERRSFRISYTLAPIFGLQLRSSKSRGIGHCVASKFSDLNMSVKQDVTKLPLRHDQIEFKAEGF